MRQAVRNIQRLVRKITHTYSGVYIARIAAAFRHEAEVHEQPVGYFSQDRMGCHLQR